MNTGTALSVRTQTFILAGGQGDRLHPLTVSRPKPAVSFGGMFRIIDFTLSNCFYSGLRHVSLVTQYRYEDLHRYVRSGWSELWNSPEGPAYRAPLGFLPPPSGKRYRGTADAVFQNSELLQSNRTDYVLVLGGDHVYRMNYDCLLRQHAETNADLTIATVEHPLASASRFGVVDVDQHFKITGFEEKPANPRPMASRPSLALVSMGIYVFKKSVLLDSLHDFRETGRGCDFGHDIIPALIQSGGAYAYDFRDEAQDAPRYWRDIGTIDAYFQASMDLVDPDGPFDPYANDECPSQPTRHPSSNDRHSLGSSLRQPGNVDTTWSVLSPDVELADGVTVKASILMPGVRVGRNARLRRVIVEEGIHIPAGFEAGFDLEQDRRFHTVSDAGVVVICKNPAGVHSKATHFAPRPPNRRVPAAMEPVGTVAMTE